MSLAVANRYARALSDAVMAPGSGLEPQLAVETLRDFAASLASSAELRTILTSPAVAVSRKRAVVSGLGDAMGVHKLLRNFFLVVVDHGRMAAIPQIAGAFEAAVVADSRHNPSALPAVKCKWCPAGDRHCCQWCLQQWPRRWLQWPHLQACDARCCCR